MAFKVFLSHSHRDTVVVAHMRDTLAANGIEPIIANGVTPEQHPQALSAKVMGLIDQSDCVIALITKSGMPSTWVQQEIGYAMTRKPIIAIVERGIPSEQLGMLQGVEYIPFDYSQAGQMLVTLQAWTSRLKTKKENGQALAGAIFFGLGMWWLANQK